MTCSNVFAGASSVEEVATRGRMNRDARTFFFNSTAGLRQAAIRFKWITVLGSIALLYAALQLPVSSEFFPQDRRDQFYVNVTLPETATIEQTNRVVLQVEDAIRKLSDHSRSRNGRSSRTSPYNAKSCGQRGSPLGARGQSAVTRLEYCRDTGPDNGR